MKRIGYHNSLEDFWRYVDKNGPIPEHRPELGPCWIWMGSIGTEGYGWFHFQMKRMRAHLLSYKLLKGQIPEGLMLDHLCRVRHCVNPGHADQVTNRENILRGIAPPAMNARKTHCKRGHSLSGENLTSRHRDGQDRRECKECNLRRKR